ncbi:hypothetical protein [Methylobacterium sp. AMS5]|uniref:hypothetical protein n=1 Tax=Methylobacterium sp. AMS5 TaxID=925818 RepID=UPI00074F82E1|nr:hypothetical protein [Methylobacterium sp. AMS5]AMB48336.1 hypothetical protein Y590_25545 [Methylobacterium sp. AMS5]
MFVGVNDNLTLAQFNANEEPGVSRAEFDASRITFYQLDGKAGDFELLRAGETKLHDKMERQRMVFPTAAMPHPWCPENRPAPVGAGYRPPSKVKPKHAPYLRVVA